MQFVAKDFRKPEDELTGVLRFEEGKVYVTAKAHADLTAKTPYELIFVVSSGVCELKTAAFRDASSRTIVGVPETDIESDEVGYLQIYGLVEDMVVPQGNYTAGHGLKIHDGAVTTTGATSTHSDAEFGVIVVGGSGVTAIDAFLKGRECSTST